MIAPSALQKLWSYREFIKALVVREFKTRYTQSVLGLLWIILEPALLVTTFSTVFTLMGRTAPDGQPFPVYFYSGVLVWRFFSKSLVTGANAFIADADLIAKLSFPRQISLIRAHAISLCDFALESLVFLGLLVFYRIPPTLDWILLPPLLLMLLAVSHGLGLLLGTLNVFLRDVGILLGTLVGVWFWFTPVVFDFPPEGRTAPLYWANPVAGIVRNYRHIILGMHRIEWELLTSAAVCALLTNVLGNLVYRRLNRRFVDAL